jgi:predicted PurR-regulated permease PerM
MAVREFPDRTAVRMSEGPRAPRFPRMQALTVATVALALIATVAALHEAKSLFLPLASAFVIGTMLSPAASFLERHRIPRSVSAVLIVTATFGLMSFVVGLITSPVLEWMERLPELGQLLRERLAFLQKPLAVFHDIERYIAGSGAATTPFQLPKIEWMQPTIEFLSPTLAEVVLFLVTLIFFIASWRDQRRSLVMAFGGRDARLRTLRILNEIEDSLGRYLVLVTIINVVVGILTGLICVIAGMPNPAGLGALAATLNFIPIIGPVAMFAVLLAVGIVSFPTLAGGMLAALLFAAMTFVEGHFATPAVVGRRLSLNAFAVFVALVFWTWLWGPMGAFLSSPLLIVALVVKEHLNPSSDPDLPGA